MVLTPYTIGQWLSKHDPDDVVTAQWYFTYGSIVVEVAPKSLKASDEGHSMSAQVSRSTTTWRWWSTTSSTGARGAALEVGRTGAEIGR